MHPAPSVIVFTTLSGLGFGLLFWLGLGLPVVTGWAAFGMFFVGFGLAVGGLAASTFHLGHPERAWRAFSQWRSSWLSREGVTAVACLVVMGIYAFGLVFLDARWSILGVLGAILALGTVFTTAMIYAQLKTVPRWNTLATPVLLVLISTAGGAILAGQAVMAIILIPLAAGAQAWWWLSGDEAFAKSGTTMASATRLASEPSEVRAFEPPHTGTNYLLSEFVYQVGRKHAVKLRLIALVLGYVAPFAVILSEPSPPITAVATAVHLTGIAVSRWLFFAEAEHVVGLYYGKR